MPVEYISPPENDPAQRNMVFKDNVLPPEYALAHRRGFHQQRGNQDTFVFTAKNAQEALAIFGVLGAVKTGRQIPPQQVPPFLMQQGYIGRDGQPNAQLLDAIQNHRNQMQFEIILPNAVMAITEAGAAFIDSKGADAPQNLKAGQGNLPAFWISFYDKLPRDLDQQAKQQRAQQLAQQNIHFHAGIKQQDNNYSGVDWALTNLSYLSRVGIDANPDALKNAEKMDRAQLVAALNGQPNPHGGNFNLEDRTNERKNEQAWRTRQQQLNQASTRHGLFHNEAEEQQTAAQQKPGGLQAFRERTQNTLVEVLLAPPPQYIADKDDLNKFKTTRQDSSGIINDFELKGGNLVVKSTGGKVTYDERFTRIAEDLYATLSRDGAGGLQLPIVIRSVEPANKTKACLHAFEKMFGKGNVEFARPEERPTPAIPASPS